MRRATLPGAGRCLATESRRSWTSENLTPTGGVVTSTGNVVSSADEVVSRFLGALSQQARWPASAAVAHACRQRYDLSRADRSYGLGWQNCHAGEARVRIFRSRMPSARLFSAYTVRRRWALRPAWPGASARRAAVPLGDRLPCRFLPVRPECYRTAQARHGLGLWRCARHFRRTLWYAAQGRFQVLLNAHSILGMAFALPCQRLAEPRALNGHKKSLCPRPSTATCEEIPR